MTRKSFSLLLLSFLAWNAYADDDSSLCAKNFCKVDIRRALEIADAAVKGSGDDIQSFEIVAAKRFVEPWNDVYPRSRSAEKSTQPAIEKLAGHTYWMIYYRLRASQLGGDVAVFLDASIGEILHFYRGR